MTTSPQQASAEIRRADVAERDTWDLNPLYSSVAAWEAEFAQVEQGLPSLGQFVGHLGESTSTLLQATELFLEIGRKIEKLYTYAHLQSDTDTTDGAALGLLEQAQNLYMRYAATTSYFNPELLALDPKRLDELLADEGLTPYRRMLKEIVRYREHTLSASEENLLAQASEVFNACDRVFSQLNNADFQFGTITVDGKELPLTHGSYAVLLQHLDRDVRRRAYFQYYQVFADHKHSLAATLSGSVKADVYLARVRKYPSALHHGIFGDNVTPQVYENLVQATNDSLEHLHRYHTKRREILGLSELELYDTYVPLVSEVKTHIPFAEACDHLAEAFRPLGDEYVSVLLRGLTEERWVDKYENRGKRSGAYSSGCYDSYPYILMNYKEDNLSDLFTLAHEAGHSMHSYYSRASQRYGDHSYTIFVAEVASTFNEQLLLNHLRKVHASDPQMLRYLANHQIEEIKRTLYRQTMFAEFEKRIHEIAEANEPLTLDVFSQVYDDILRRYSGPEMVIHDISKLECLRIPHFYSAFYVYKYATGISAAIALSQRVMAGDTEARDRYLNFLRAGCTKYPVELLQDAGVDMTKPDAVRTALQLFGTLTDEL